jgi:hypothetical protein
MAAPSRLYVKLTRYPARLRICAKAETKRSISPQNWVHIWVRSKRRSFIFNNLVASNLIFQHIFAEPTPKFIIVDGATCKLTESKGINVDTSGCLCFFSLSFLRKLGV